MKPTDVIGTSAFPGDRACGMGCYRRFANTTDYFTRTGSDITIHTADKEDL